MIDHVTLLVTDYDQAKRTYLKALEPLGYALVMELTPKEIPGLPGRFAGLGVHGKPDLWLRESRGPVSPTHVAIAAKTRAQVDAFHAAALEVGMTEIGRASCRERV